MLEEISHAVTRGENFAIETTLAGLGYLRHIRAWRKAGYHVSLYFLTLQSVEIAVMRVALRVRQGGHSIPDDVIRRRFEAGHRNFFQSYRFVVDTWALYDNLGAEPILIEKGKNL